MQINFTRLHGLNEKSNRKNLEGLIRDKKFGFSKNDRKRGITRVLFETFATIDSLTRDKDVYLKTDYLLDPGNKTGRMVIWIEDEGKVQISRTSIPYGYKSSNNSFSQDLTKIPPVDNISSSGRLFDKMIDLYK